LVRMVPRPPYRIEPLEALLINVTDTLPSQPIAGPFTVSLEGTINLDYSYGSVYVGGLTPEQAQLAIRRALGNTLKNPQVNVVLDGAGFGQQVFRLPATGNETVLDAISFVQGIAPVSSKRRIVLARPSPVHLGCNQILPVDWRAITEGGSTATNYQVFPGDRV